MGPEDLDLLGDVVGGRSGQTGGAHEDHGLARQVDVLLVLGAVARDRLVAELGQLHPDLASRDLVHTVAHDRPVAPGRGERLGRRGDRRSHLERSFHLGGQIPQCRQQQLLLGAGGSGPAGHLVRDRLGQQQACGDLGVERLGRRDAHLHVPTVGGVEHPVGLVGQVAPAPVDDRDHRRAPGAHQVHGPVGVGGGPRLADGDHQGVGHVGTQLEPGQLGGEHGLDLHVGLRQEVAQVVGEALTGDGRGALADDEDAVDVPGAQRIADVARQRLGAEHDADAVGTLDQLAAERRAERRRRRGDLLEQEVRVVPTVDVPGGDLGLLHVLGPDRQLRAVVGPPGHAVEGSRRIGSQLDDLAPAAGRVVRIRRRLAVHAQVRTRSPRPRRTARRRRCTRPPPARRRSPDHSRAAPGGVDPDRRRSPRRSRPNPSSDATVSRNASVAVAPLLSRRDISVGMTFASVVMSAAMRSDSAAVRSA